MFTPMSPREVGKELEAMNEEYKIRTAKEVDQSDQLDRIEGKLDEVLEGLKFLTSIQPK